MSEVIKDAPCLCKDDDMERMQPKRNFFQKILYNRLRKSNRSYLYPVLYSDGVISNAICDKIGRKPLGIIFENHLITLRDSSKRMKWYEAMDYCRNTKVFGQSCEAGKMVFWKKCISEKGGCNINKTLFYLIGKRIKTKRKYWSAHGDITLGAWSFCLAPGDEYYDNKFNRYAVRPILDFSKLPSEVITRFVWLT